jgi:hypothetical protein
MVLGALIGGFTTSFAFGLVSRELKGWKGRGLNRGTALRVLALLACVKLGMLVGALPRG